MFTRYAYADAEILEIKGSPARQVTASLDTAGDYDNYRTADNYMYVRIRAISSRVNKNSDGWPSVELAGSREILNRHQSSTGFTVEAKEGNQDKGFATFVGKPIFVDHNNSNPKRARGVIVDSKFRVLDHKTAASDEYWKSSDVDPEHLPASEVELLLEVDAKQYPKFAKAIKDGELDGFSMGANVEYTKCSHCGNEAHDPASFCSHVMMKGAHHDYKTADGKRVSKKSYENCFSLGFFEISGVFEPADETALTREVKSSVHEADIYPAQEGQTPPDPLRPEDVATETNKLFLMKQYGYPEDKAAEVAMAQSGQGKPAGHGEGDVYTPKRIDYYKGQPGNPQFDANGMPGPGGLKGFPPPIYPDQELGPGIDRGFHDRAQDELNKHWGEGNRPVMNNPFMSALRDPTRVAFERLAENPLPQDMMTKAPDEVDTLRQEQTCPICGNDMESEQCKVCGYTKPPKEFDNPDLQEAQKVRDEMKEQDEAQASPQDPTQPAQNPTQPSAVPGPGQGPLTSQGPSKSLAAAAVTNDMRWTPKVNPKTAARINQVETPMRPAGSSTTNEPKSEVVLSDQTQPVTSAMRTARRLIEAAQTNNGETMNTRTADGPTPPGDTSADKRVDVMGVGGVDQASNEEASKADAQVDVNGVGGTGVEGVEADKTETLPTAGEGSDDAGFNTDKTTDDSGPTSTYGDSDGGEKATTSPVTSETPYWVDESKWSNVRLYADDNDKSLTQQPQQGGGANSGDSGKAVQGVQPIAETFGERVNVLEHKTSPSNNSGATKTWSGTDGNGVLKQQDPVTKEDQEWGGVKVPDVTLHTTAAVKAHMINVDRLVTAEQELGLLSREDRWNRMAALADADPREVASQINTLAKVKTAGVKMAATQRLATRVPRSFGNQTAANHDFERIASEKAEKESVTDAEFDSALFTR